MRRVALTSIIALALVTAACAGPPTAEQCADRLEITLTYPRIDQSDGAVAAVRSGSTEVRLISVATADRVEADIAAAGSIDVTLNPDGSRLVESTEPDHELAVVDVATGQRTPLGVVGIRPAWSPDGSRIAYAALDGAIWVVEPDGSNSLRLSDRDAGSPSWSLDGAQLAISVDAEPGALGFEAIHVMDSTGSGDERVARGVTLDAPSWSPDGTRLAFHDFDGINISCADGALAYEVAADGLFPVWSPDGTQVVFTSTSDQRGGPGLFVIDALGGTPIRLTDDAGDIAVAWFEDAWP